MADDTPPSAAVAQPPSHPRQAANPHARLTALSPEILSRIVALLPPNALRSCARTCHKLQRPAEALIYAHLDIPIIAGNAELRKPRSMQGPSASAAASSQLAVSTGAISIATFINGDDWNDEPDWDDPSSTSNVEAEMRLLAKLTTAFQSDACRASAVRKLRLNIHAQHVDACVDFVNTVKSGLISLSVRPITEWDEDGSSMIREFYPRFLGMTPNHAIIELKTYMGEAFSTYDLLRTAAMLPNLSRLHILAAGFDVQLEPWIVPVDDAHPHALRRLRQLIIPRLCVGMWDVVESVVNHAPNLLTVSINSALGEENGGDGSISLGAAQALRGAPSLRNFQYIDDGYETGDDLSMVPVYNPATGYVNEDLFQEGFANLRVAVFPASPEMTEIMGGDYDVKQMDHLIPRLPNLQHVLLACVDDEVFEGLAHWHFEQRFTSFTAPALKMVRSRPELLSIRMVQRKRQPRTTTTMAWLPGEVGYTFHRFQEPGTDQELIVVRRVACHDRRAKPHAHWTPPQPRSRLTCHDMDNEYENWEREPRSVAKLDVYIERIYLKTRPLPDSMCPKLAPSIGRYGQVVPPSARGTMRPQEWAIVNAWRDSLSRSARTETSESSVGLVPVGRDQLSNAQAAQ